MVTNSSEYSEFRPGPGNDLVDDGPPGNLLVYGDVAGLVYVDLQAGYTTDGAERDTLIDIVDVLGSQGADTLLGDDRDNDLRGGSVPSGIVPDVIVGRGGNDTLSGPGRLFGGPGDDTFTPSIYEGVNDDDLRGGPGVDLVDFSYTYASLVVDLSAGTATSVNIGLDHLLGIENVLGTSSSDVITGSAVANELHGQGGTDQIFGGGGNDALYGELRDDDLDGGPGVDTVDGGVDNDTCTGETVLHCEA